MEWVDAKQKIPIKSWCEYVEPNAMAQAINLSLLPFAYHHIALMADCHLGFGMPIGGVMAAKDVVIPNAVGSDISCGVIVVKTNIKTEIDRETRKSIMNDIRKDVPVGTNRHDDYQQWVGFSAAPDLPVIKAEFNLARKQLGTLGSGNHFISLEYGSDEYMYIMIHSGSRHMGYQIAKEYHDKAKEYCVKWHADIPISDLAFFPLGTKYADEYLICMDFAMDFAYENRERMMNCVMDVLAKYFQHFMISDKINVHHNYAAMEHHFGKNVMVHRKGATLARDNLGIIPGSQGTASYIVRGKSNPDSFNSCSHGAGRVMGRNQAKNELDLATEIKLLDDKGIIHSIRSKKDLDEAPSAYKDIDVVMASQMDLVDIITKLEPLAVIKG